MIEVNASAKVDGNYPKRALDTFPPSILRRFTEDEKKLIKGSADFYAIGAVLCLTEIQRY